MSSPNPYLGSLILLVLASCQDKPLADLSGIRGAWSSQDSRYEGRFFELTEEKLVIGTGEGDASVFEVESVTREPIGAATYHYEINYVFPTGEGGIFVIEHSETEDAVRFSNQRNLIWKRKNT